jgi:hypothetical protein
MTEGQWFLLWLGDFSPPAILKKELNESSLAYLSMQLLSRDVLKKRKLAATFEDLIRHSCQVVLGSTR